MNNFNEGQEKQITTARNLKSFSLRENIYKKKIEQRNISKSPKFFDQDWKQRSKSPFKTNKSRLKPSVSKLFHVGTLFGRKHFKIKVNL